MRCHPSRPWSTGDRQCRHGGQSLPHRDTGPAAALSTTQRHRAGGRKYRHMRCWSSATLKRGMRKESRGTPRSATDHRGHCPPSRHVAINTPNPHHSRSSRELTRRVRSNTQAPLRAACSPGERFSDSELYQCPPLERVQLRKRQKRNGTARKPVTTD